MKITRDHPTFLVKPALQRICEPFFQQHGFSYFQYLRCYPDGSFSLMATETGFFELYDTLPRAPVIYSSFTQEHENQHSYWFSWDEELPAGPVQLVREKLHLHHGMTLMRRSKHYYDMIAFALPSTRLNVASFYMSKYKAMEQYILEFDKNHSDLIQNIHHQSIVIAEPFKDVNYQKICLHKGRLELQSPLGLVHITSQELACLRMLLQGQTYKQIGKMLELSPRTVETYIGRLKDRTGIQNRHELKALISLCQ